MDDLLRAMQLIDKHSDKLPEGDYLDICNHLKRAYNKRVDPVYFFDYDDFAILPIGPSAETFQYFHDYFFDKALNLDSDYIRGQISYLEKELGECRPVKRITKRVRDRVLRHYCQIHGVESAVFSKKDLDSMCKAYVGVENDFRARYRASIEQRINWLEQSDDHLDTL